MTRRKAVVRTEDYDGRLALTVTEYCRAMGIKNSYRVYKAMERGEIPNFIPPGVKRGKRIPVEWIRAEIERRTQERKD